MDAPLTVLHYAPRRLGQALLAVLGLAVAAALLVTGGADGGRAALDWLARAARLDFGRTVDGAPVAAATAAALPATSLLALAAALIGLVAGWGGGLLLALAAYASPRRYGGALLKVLAWVADACQGVPTFWLGGALVVLLSVGLGLFPPGGIVDPALPAFGSAAYRALLRARPAIVLGDLLGHLVLPALTLALAGLATQMRLVATALPAELGAPYARVARAVGLSRPRLLRRPARPTLPVVVGGAAADLPLLAGALVLVEYLFGWPGLGLLAYHAARTGDVATLGALLLLFGLVVIAASLVTDLSGAWADPRQRRREGAP